ncbi:MAG: DUF3737 family protein [Treponema sp.]|nr:DUF3737 family protein [Treponema sp.]MBQ6057121.1 DUF3737 family protein [Treponema sp.]MBR0487965.1 DUF3737 family protein [Treponema sp.]
MKTYQNKTFDEERALYGQKDITVKNCRFEGPADGESAFKEGQNITATDNFYDLRYPFWHDTNLTIKGGQMSPNCRAALWYSRGIRIDGLKMHGIKALRECRDVIIQNCDIDSPEFGWSTSNIVMENTKAKSEYFMMRSENLKFNNIEFSGKYSFQYISDSSFENCNFDTKDAFWHAKNVTVKNCIIKGEYLGWYSENLTFENCIISGTQPLCYCKNLKLINCRMSGADLAFEKSDVSATILSSVDSIKNPRSGCIQVQSVGQVIMDDENAKGVVCTKEVA